MLNNVLFHFATDARSVDDYASVEVNAWGYLWRLLALKQIRLQIEVIRKTLSSDLWAAVFLWVKVLEVCFKHPARS